MSKVREGESTRIDSRNDINLEYNYNKTLSDSKICNDEKVTDTKKTTK